MIAMYTCRYVILVVLHSLALEFRMVTDTECTALCLKYI
jgi:hypothetical protein